MPIRLHKHTWKPIDQFITIQIRAFTLGGTKIRDISVGSICGSSDCSAGRGTDGTVVDMKQMRDGVESDGIRTEVSRRIRPRGENRE